MSVFAGAAPAVTRAQTSLRGVLQRPPPHVSPRAAFVARRAFFGFIVAANFVLLAIAVRGLLFAPPPPDWQGLVDAAARISHGADPFAAQTYAFRWSPLAAWLLVPFTAAGLVVWQLLHFAALAALPRRIALITLLCFAFWVDVGMGNVVVFGFVLAWLALTKGRLSIVAFTVFALLVPRPLYVTLLIYLFLNRPEERRAMLLAGAIVLAATLATGWLPAWLTILATSGGDIANVTNMAPSQLIGVAWLPIAWVAAFVAYRRRHLGLASLFASPYWLPYYFLMVLLDLAPLKGPDAKPASAPTPASAPLPTPSLPAPYS